MDRATAEIDRAGAAAELLALHGGVFRRIAKRHSRCAEDAEDAFQRASLILLTKAPASDPERLVGWMAVVTRHEAMAVRRGQARIEERLRSSELADPLDEVATDHPGPAERFERAESIGAAWLALAELRPGERRAILLQAQGYSYAEICELCGWSYTKVNRLLAEGRARLRAVGPIPVSKEFAGVGSDEQGRPEP